jgi:hypothetical protein
VKKRQSPCPYTGPMSCSQFGEYVFRLYQSKGTRRQLRRVATRHGAKTGSFRDGTQPDSIALPTARAGSSPARFSWRLSLHSSYSPRSPTFNQALRSATNPKKKGPNTCHRTTETTFSTRELTARILPSLIAVSPTLRKKRRATLTLPATGPAFRRSHAMAAKKRIVRIPMLPSQRKFLDSASPVKGFSGPVGSGKTYALGYQALRSAAEKAAPDCSAHLPTTCWRPPQSRSCSNCSTGIRSLTRTGRVRTS